MLSAARGELLRILPTLSRVTQRRAIYIRELTVYSYFESAHTVVNTSGDRKQVSRLPRARMTQGVSYSFRGMTARTNFTVLPVEGRIIVQGKGRIRGAAASGKPPCDRHTGVVVHDHPSRA